MEDWKEYKLGEVLSDKGYIRGPFGSALKRGDMKDSGIPVYEQQHAIYQSRDFRFYIDENKFNEMKRFQVQTNDLVISCSGTVGKVTIIDKNDPKGIISQALLILRVNSGIILPKYLQYFFTSENGYNSIISRSSGSVQINIAKRDVIEGIPLHLPPLSTQQKIAQILSSLDDKIELNNKINANLEQQAQVLFKSWFVDFEPFGREMPAGWKEGKLGEFVEIKRGGSPRPIQNFMADEGLRWLKISDVTSLSAPFVLKIAEHIKEEGLSKTVFLKAGSLVLSNSATPGIPKIIDLDTCIHDGWLYFPKSQLSNEYLYLLFKEIRPKLVSLGNGSIFTNLKTDILKNFKVCLPPSDILNQFQSIAHPMFEKMLCTQREIKQIETIRDTLLSKLMNGEIEV